MTGWGQANNRVNNWNFGSRNCMELCRIAWNLRDNNCTQVKPELQFMLF